MPKVTALGPQDAENCPIRNVLDRVGDKWSLLIFCVLEEGPMRFNAIKRELGDITQRVLTSTLRKLEADGYVTREVVPSSPPKVSYGLTDRGRALFELMLPLIAWAKAEHAGIRATRSAYEAAR